MIDMILYLYSAAHSPMNSYDFKIYLHHSEKSIYTWDEKLFSLPKKQEL